MAKRNLFLGTASGKIGDIVLYRSGGEQRSRVRVVPANPQTDAQIIQRMAFAQAAIAGAAMREVIDHSFESKPYGYDSVRYFTQINAPRLRNLIYEHLGVPDSSQPVNLHAKGINVVAPNSFAIARGSLAGYDPWTPSHFEMEDDVVLIGQAKAVFTANLTADLKWRDVVGGLGLLPGAEYAFCAIFVDLETSLASYYDLSTLGEGNRTDGWGSQLRPSVFRAIRLVLKPATDPIYNEPVVETDFGAFIKLIADLDKTTGAGANPEDFFFHLGKLSFSEPDEDTGNVTLTATATLGDGGDVWASSLFGVPLQFVPAAMGTIVSVFENGKWRNSNSDMRLYLEQKKPEAGVDYIGLAPVYALQSWRSLSVSDSDYFLQQGGDSRV